MLSLQPFCVVVLKIDLYIILPDKMCIFIHSYLIVCGNR